MPEKKIPYEELLNNYNKVSGTQAKNAVLESIKITSYVPFSAKASISELIVKNSCLDKDGNVFVDSVKKYLFYILAIMDMYTNIEIDGKDSTNAYDALNSSGILSYILKEIPKKELTEFRVIVQMRFDDLIRNYYEPHAFITKKIADIWTRLSPAVANAVDDLEKFAKNIDPNTVEKYIKMIAR